MKNKIAVFLISFLFALTPFFEISASDIYMARIEGEIKAGTVQYLNRVIMEAEFKKASYILIEIDTPGGLLDSTKKIIDLMIGTDVKTIVFVNKSGGWAYSAGSFILMASDYAFAHPEASIGAAEPRIMGESEGDMKMIEAMDSWMGNLAAGQGRNAEVAKRFVNDNLTLNGKEAFSLGVIDGTPSNLSEVFDLLGLSDPQIITIEPTFFEKVFDVLSHPYLISLFLTLGLFGLIFAFRTGEFEISGILGFIFLTMGLWGIGIINFSALGAILLILGIFLLVVEFFGDPGFGILGILGVLSLTLGVFNFGSEPLMAPRIFDFVTLFTIGVLSSLMILFIIIGKGVALTFKKRPATGPESLKGKRGKVIETIFPFGRIEVGRESWSARSEDNSKIDKGTIMEITKVEGNTLIVKNFIKK